MPLSIMTPSGLRQIKRLRVMHFGQLRTIRTLKVMDDGVLKLVGNFLGDLAVSLSASQVGGISTGGPVTTNQVTATATGGQIPYTYAWSLLDHSNPGTPFPLNPNGASTTFRGSPSGDATFRVLVTDALGQQTSATVQAFFESNQ